MANFRLPVDSLLIVCILGASILLSYSTVLAKSHRPISDLETRQKKLECYTDIDSGLWGPKCKSSTVEKENCALRCLSPTCYELVYASDPLEEGEKDFMEPRIQVLYAQVVDGESIEGIKGTFDY